MEVASTTGTDGERKMTSVATRILGIIGLVAVFTGVLYGEAILIVGAVILLLPRPVTSIWRSCGTSS